MLKDLVKSSKFVLNGGYNLGVYKYFNLGPFSFRIYNLSGKAVNSLYVWKSGSDTSVNCIVYNVYSTLEIPLLLVQYTGKLLRIKIGTNIPYIHLFQIFTEIFFKQIMIENLCIELFTRIFMENHTTIKIIPI